MSVMAAGLRGRWRSLVPAVAPVHRIALFAVASLVVVATGWNVWAGLQLQTPLINIVAVTAPLFLLAGIYTAIRPAPVAAEIALYLGLWLVYPFFGTVLSYLFNRLGYPLQDAILAKIDAAMGFHWLTWGKFVSSQTKFDVVLNFAYESYLGQPLVFVVIFAIWGPKYRNGEILISVIVSLWITVIISAVVPAVGPAEAFGLGPAPGAIIRALRSATPPTLPYEGIISFPSFHTVMAVLFTYAHRGLRWSLPPVAILNMTMLTAVPLSGDHYLIDMVGGAGVAVLAISVTRKLVASAPPGRAGSPPGRRGC